MSRWLVLCFWLSLPLGARAAEMPVSATVETSLSTAKGQIRQYAFDGDPDTYFLSVQNPGTADHFTLVFDKPVALKSVAVTTGTPKRSDNRLEAGILEISEDGKTFTELAKLVDGSVLAKADGKKVRAVRLKPTAEQKHAVAIREFTIDSDPPVAVFQFPVEFTLDCADAPEMKDWLEKVAHTCLQQYPSICADLRSDGYKPPTVIVMALKNSYNGVAATGGDHITGSVKYFKAHPDDVGAMIHETIHVVQQYRTRGNPGWLVEGVADYLRWYKFEPKKPRPLSPNQAKYKGSYRVTAAFLDYLTEKYDKRIVYKLNKAMREGEYKDEIFKLVTKKSLPELEEEWKESLKK